MYGYTKFIALVLFNNNKILKQEYPSKIAKSEISINLRDHGILAGDIQFGINMPVLESEGGYNIDNTVNRFFVYRAFMVDNMHNKKNEIGIYKCNFR